MSHKEINLKIDWFWCITSYKPEMVELYSKTIYLSSIISTKNGLYFEKQA